MVAHASSFCNAAAVVTSTPPSTRTRRTAPSSAVAPRNRAPLATLSAGTGKKARTTTTAGRRRRRCVEVMRRKMEALRRLVPSGGDGDGEEADDGGVDELLFRAADYIVRLQVQVKAMQLMVDVLQHSKDS